MNVFQWKCQGLIFGYRFLKIMVFKCFLFKKMFWSDFKINKQIKKIRDGQEKIQLDLIKKQGPMSLVKQQELIVILGKQNDLNDL